MRNHIRSFVFEHYPIMIVLCSILLRIYNVISYGSLLIIVVLMILRYDILRFIDTSYFDENLNSEVSECTMETINLE